MVLHDARLEICWGYMLLWQMLKMHQPRARQVILVHDQVCE